MEPYAGADLGAYRIERKVGEGAFGAVWCGSHSETGERVALKVLLAAAATNPEQVSRFHREAKLLGMVRSTNVARMVDFIVDERFGVVLVMELIDGELLSDLMNAGQLGVTETVEIGAQVMDGVADLHAVGIVHRDLKPNNIMLCSKADGSRRVVIFDLGLSRLVRDAATTDSTRSLTGSHVALGTLECMAPEQILNARDVTERSDVYSVGAILYRAVSGAYPFASEDERDLARKKLTVETPELPLAPTEPIAEGLRTIVMKATRRRPAQRYESAKAMRDELRSLRDLARARDAAARAPKPDPTERAYRARMPTLDLEDRPAASAPAVPPRGTVGSVRPLVVGVTVFSVLVGAAIAWRALGH
jgi:serine/threonine-protein kinase